VRDRVEALVDGYDNERISRAELVDQLAEYLGGSAEPSGSHSMFQTLGLNHVALAVSDVGAMAEFLGQHLGTTVIRQSESQGFLAAGANNFVGLFQRPSPRTHWDEPRAPVSSRTVSRIGSSSGVRTGSCSRSPARGAITRGDTPQDLETRLSRSQRRRTWSRRCLP
jgi:catechol 2,3-dioxygenase-like lactoylglutathione lyase family enzyme